MQPFADALQFGVMPFFSRSQPTYGLPLANLNVFVPVRPNVFAMYVPLKPRICAANGS